MADNNDLKDSPDLKDNSDLQGLRGWLILVGIGVVLGPIRLGVELLPLYYTIFTDGTFELLTTPTSDYYHPMWGGLLIFEIAFNVLLFLGSCSLVYLYFAKHYLFPKGYIAIVLVSLVFIPLDAWLVSFPMPHEPMFDPETTKELTRAVISAVIWVPYMLVSKRVKATFVEKQPGNADHEEGREAGASA